MIQTRALHLVNEVSDLISLPEVSLKINELVDDPGASVADMAQVISLDVAITTKLLKIANSSFYRFPSRIDTVSRAVTIIGTRELRFLILASSAVRSFDNINNKVIDISSFWRHSVYTAVVSRLLAAKCNVLHKERLFVSGLLHDVGHLVMSHLIPDLVQVIKHREKTANIPIYEAERDVYDIDHAVVGAELLKMWGLPKSLHDVILHHHEPEKSTDYVLETSIVHLANSIAKLGELGSTDLSQAPRVSPVAWEVTGLSPDVIAPVLQDARAQFLEALLLFLPGVAVAS
ncbi:Predicted signal transduction protein [hydrothermal vent metagenome]|uniref:Predicted signal transduction protein n=1 Tax=hydrothermal vent metagenome TaxID=652676 RepID=A0A3B0ZB35_9ZZZZ